MLCGLAVLATINAVSTAKKSSEKADRATTYSDLAYAKSEKNAARLMFVASLLTAALAAILMSAK